MEPANSEFSSILIHKGDMATLGTSLYSTVYKATCDHLPCAAKLFLFKTNSKLLEKFEQEMALLRDLRHPNIVLRLGHCQDTDYKLPVLLMELMDESLTSFLRRSRNPLQHHLQVDLGHDIVLALTYLHSKQIVLHSLSSNNVLLKGKRAKVADFITSRLIEVGSVGKEDYMPPEDLTLSPVKSEKTDVFSFGVLLIQIVTREYPNPGPHLVSVQDPQSPVGTSYRPVLETERRQNHISLIESTHPLLDMITACLHYTREERPTSQDLCKQIAELKREDAYMESVKETMRRKEEHEKLLLEKDDTIRDLEQTMAKKEKEIIKLSSELENVREKLSHYSNESSASPDITNSEQIKFEWSKLKTKSMISEQCFSSATDGKVVYFAFTFTHASKNFYGVARDAKILKFNVATEDWSETLIELENFSLEIIDGLLTAIGGNRRGIYSGNCLQSLMGESGNEVWTTYYPLMPDTLRNLVTTVYRDLLIVMGEYCPNSTHPYSDDKHRINVMKIKERKWYEITSRITTSFSSGCLTPCGDHIIYFSGISDNSNRYTKYAYYCSLSDITPKNQANWTQIAETPKYGSAIIELNGQIFAFGGQTGNDNFKYSYETTDPIRQRE